MTAESLPGPRTISQRELRNNSAQVLRDVEAGETFVITNNGKPVARLTPVVHRMGLPIAVPRNPNRKASDIEAVETGGPSIQEILDEMRTDRV